MKKTKKQNKNINFNKNINKLLKDIHNDLQISKNGIDYINEIINYLLEKICLECKEICRRNEYEILDGKIIQISLKNLLYGELLKCAIESGIKGVMKCNTNSV